ncbi:MAG: formylglycine-generating enzyme family protein [Terriglobia bacterium]
MNRNRLLCGLLFLIVFRPLLMAQDTHFKPQFEQIPGPDDAKTNTRECCYRSAEIPDPAKAFQTWIEDVRHWRDERRIRIGYDPSQYERPQLKWAQSSFIQPQMMIEDRYFYDPVAHKYTVDRYLDDLEKRYGGIDSVLIWHTYPNIGIDNRDQYDLLRDMPGGIEGLRQMIRDFHRRGVRVLFPVMLWDQGTRDPKLPNAEATAKAMAEIGADGINGDTLDGVPRSFRIASDKTDDPIVLEPEVGPADEAIQWNNMSWGYWKYPFVPMISRYKWLEPRHMVNVCDRWNHRKTDNLQFAFFNGVGYESWENIWGIWNQITPRDAEALRRVAKIERAFAPLLVSQGWVPHTPTLRYGIFASMFPGDGQTLWTIVNRNQYDVAGKQIEVPYHAGERFYDVWHGEELKPEIHGDQATLRFDIEGEGFGALLAQNELASGKVAALLETMKEFSRTPLKSLSAEWHFLPQKLVEIPPTAPAASAPAGMVAIPAGDYNFQTAGIMIEGGNDVGVDVQFPWEDSPRRFHSHKMHVKSFYIDKYPVTNAEFKKFVDATRYHPVDDHNFLRDWKNGTYPEGWGDKPVTWVSLEDARAYASWAGKRLPHEWEWQYAAQGTDGRLYPWGNEWDPSAVPVPDKGRDMRPSTNVDAYPEGASPFGVMDMVGNVWQWTDEFMDEHTRAGILKGGSYYQPQSSLWYFPQAYKLNEHGKYLLMAPSKDRAGTLGFRCVKDTP